MKFLTKIYLAEKGKGLELCNKFREDYINHHRNIQAKLKEHGIDGYSIGFDGYILNVRFENIDLIPDNFTKPKPGRITRPYKKNLEWTTYLESFGKEPEPKSYLRDYLNVPSIIKYKSESSEGSRTIGHPLHEYQIIFFDESPYSPIAAVVADVAKEIKLTELEYEIVNKDIKDWSMPEDFKEILDEEWDLMREKHKERSENVS